MSSARDRMDCLQRAFDENPSLAMSLEDFEPSARPSPAMPLDIPSQHSGFRSRTSALNDESEPESLGDSSGPWSPPAWRRPASGWYQQDRQPAKRQRSAVRQSTAYVSPARSRETSPQVEDDNDLTLPANVPLPGSPLKRSESPEAQRREEKEFGRNGAAPVLQPKDAQAQPKNNYIRFAVRAEVQHRTEPIENAVSYVRHQIDRITNSKASILSFFGVIFVSYLLLKSLFQVPDTGPGPDLIKVAGLARSFEPLIHYSENGVQQIGDLQETGVAVWDLGESVRFSNMTSAPIIVKELDNLSESLKTLAIELTRFFANVDGDIDSILIVMDWAKRELHQIASFTPGKIDSAYENLHTALHKLGGTSVSNMMTTLFGQTNKQVTKTTLQRTFDEFLNVLEESINTELTYSTALFGLFEAIDRQFLNLQRTVIRETDSQEAAKERSDAELANLWRKIIGTNASRVNKYNKNKQLLEGIKERTVQNKLILVDHNGRLLQLKSNLEILRKKLVSPLVRSNDSSTLSVTEQISGLDGTYEYLRGARERQKSKLMERLYGAGSRRIGIIAGDGYAIDSS